MKEPIKYSASMMCADYACLRDGQNRDVCTEGHPGVRAWHDSAVRQRQALR